MVAKRPAERLDLRYDVRSVSRAISLLELLGGPGADDGLSVTQIARATGVSKSAAFAMLQTLCNHGFVSDEGTGQGRRYRLGTALARLGAKVRGHLSLRDLAKPVLRQLASETEMPARLAVLEGNNCLTLEQVDAPISVQVALRMGQRETLHNTGLGKAVLALLPDDEVINRLKEAGMPRETPYTITSIDEMLAHLQQVRRVGYAIDDEEGVEGIFCVGSGILDQQGKCIGAVSVTSVKTRSSSLRYPSIGDAVRRAAQEISSRLGWQQPSTTQSR